MGIARLAPTWLKGCALAAVAATVAPLPAAEPAARATSSRQAEPNQAFLDAIPTPYRAAVSTVLRAPTLSTKASEGPFPAHRAVYDWLVDHPDRTSLAWRRLGIPCVKITDLGHGRYTWSDENGSEMTWQAVAKFSDGVVWYATGKVKPGTVLPVVPVQAVAVLRSPRMGLDAGGRGAMFEPSVQIFVQTESRTAIAALRLAGPSAPRMAEQGAEQMLVFFSGPARHLWENPGELEKLLAAPAEAKPAAKAGEK